MQFRARPGLGRGPRVVDTGVITALDNYVLLNTEVGIVLHRFHASSELTMVSLDAPTLGDPSFKAWYVQAGYFLTGEARAYDGKKGLWGNLKPCCSFLDDNCCCKGAIELAARVDRLDLNDGAITGGQLTTITVGVNWYLNAHVRLMFDFTTANIKDRFTAGGAVIADADVNSFLMRVDIHF